MRRSQRWFTYRIVLLNTHTGIGLRNGVMGWVRRSFMPRVMFVLSSEVRDRGDLERALGKRWRTLPDGKGTHGNNYVSFKQSRIGRPGKRRDRFVVVEWDSQNTAFGSKHPRAMNGVFLLDRKTHRILNLSSLHPDPLGKGVAGASPGQLSRHKRQVEAHVEWHDRPNPRIPEYQATKFERVDICGGDVNERMDPSVWGNMSPTTFRDTAVYAFSRIGMRPGRTVADRNVGETRLMELFVDTDKPHVRVKRRLAADSGVKGMNHEVVGYWIKVARWQG